MGRPTQRRDSGDGYYIYPFTEFSKEGDPPARRTSTNPALLIADSLARFITFSLLPDLKVGTSTQAFLRDCVMHFGKPKRIIVGQGGPGFAGRKWASWVMFLDGNT